MELQLETTSTCNAKCSFCVYPVAGRAGGLMAMSLFKGIIDEAAGIPVIDRFVFHGLGEPLLDPHLEDRIWYARSKKPQAHREIFTNGVYLAPEKFEALKAAGLTSLTVSVNAVRAEQHEKIMGLVGKFDTVQKNARYAIDNQGDCAVHIHAVKNDDSFTREDVPVFYAQWGNRNFGGHGICIVEGNWAGSNRTQHRNWKPNESCYRALGQMYILYDGRVSMCCFDPTGKTIFGDLNKQTIRQVYNSKEYLNFRIAHDQDRADEYQQCRDCTRI